MRLKNLAVCMVVALFLVSSGSAYVFSAGPLGGPPAPDLTGTWNVWSEGYFGDLDTPGVYETGYTVLVITEQTGSVFTGYSYDPGETEKEYISGVVVFHQVRLTDYDAIITGTLYGPNTIIGTFSNVPTEAGIPGPYDEYGAGKFIAERVVE